MRGVWAEGGRPPVAALSGDTGTWEKEKLESPPPGKEALCLGAGGGQRGEALSPGCGPSELSLHLAEPGGREDAASAQGPQTLAF